MLMITILSSKVVEEKRNPAEFSVSSCFRSLVNAHAFGRV